MSRFGISSVLILPIFLFILSGCGGSDNSATDAPPQSPAAQAANDAYVKSAGKDFMNDKTKGAKGGGAAKKQATPEAPR